MGSMMSDLAGVYKGINGILQSKGKPVYSTLDELMVELFNEVAYVWPRVGYPPLVTPFSQYVKNIALMNLLSRAQDEPRFSRMDESMWGMILGKSGKLPGEVAPEIIELAKTYKDVLASHELYATGTTGTLIMGETGLKIHRMKSGPLGGDQQIGAMLANGELDLIIFLRDPLTAQPHEPDVSALLRLCDVQKIPLATNASSAIIMLESLKNGTFPISEK